MTRSDMILISGKSPHDLMRKIDEWQNGASHGCFRSIKQFDIQWVGGDGWVAFILFSYVYTDHMDTYELPVSSSDWTFNHKEKTWTTIPTRKK